MLTNKSSGTSAKTINGKFIIPALAFDLVFGGVERYNKDEKATMENRWNIMNPNHDFMDHWLALDAIQNKVKKELEDVLQTEHNLSLKGFYVLYYLSQAPDKKLRLQQLQEAIDLSQSALSRIVAHMESNSCGVLEKYSCPDDRRGTYTRLTDLGERKLQQSLVTFHEILKSHLAAANVELLMKQLIEAL